LPPGIGGIPGSGVSGPLWSGIDDSLSDMAVIMEFFLYFGKMKEQGSKGKKWWMVR
jgi:hypothetical protein